MKKIFTFGLALIIFCFATTVFAYGSATDKLVQMEQTTYGAEQVGAILDRISRLEKDYSGKNMSGNLNVRIDSVYDILYGNNGAPSILAKVNAIEWNAYNEVSGESIINRVSLLEKELIGKNSDSNLINRIDRLARASFGKEQIPLNEMQISGGVLVKVELEDKVDSRTLQQDDLINVRVVENVFVDGKLIFAKGLRGKGKVQSVRKAKGWTGSNGKIIVDFFTLNAIDGTDVEVYVGEESKHEMKNQEMIQGASLVGMNINNEWHKIMVHGKNLEISAGTRLYVQTKKFVRLYGLNTKSVNLNLIENDMAG